MGLIIPLAIPIIFFVLCIRNIVIIIKAKKDNDPIKKSLIIKTIIFGVIFILIVIFYISLIYSLSKAVVNM